MPIPIVRMTNTAAGILRRHGGVALVRAVVRKLRSMLDTAYHPDEVEIAYDVLNGKTEQGKVMVDVGAHHGESFARFARSGWQVYAFEPDSENREVLLQEACVGLPNVRIDPRGLADYPAPHVPWYRSAESSGISGLLAFHPTHVRCESVEITTLKEFAQEAGLRAIDFLKIDTEGFDLLVLRGVPWERLRPKLVLCEFEDRKTVRMGYGFHDLARFLSERGYLLIVSEWFPIRRYGIRHDWRRFATYPCDLEDANGWGNILATNDESVYRRLLSTCGIDTDKAMV